MTKALECKHGRYWRKCEVCALIEAEKTITDNSAVIRALEQRVEELEKVAEAGEVSCLHPNEHWADEAHRKALRAAGYLND